MNPTTLAVLSSRWGIAELGERFPGERASHVAPVVDRQGRSLVLKICPDAHWAESEYRALSHWDGRGSVRARGFDRELAAVLVERADPGGSLRSAGLEDAEGTQIFADVAARLHAAGPPRSAFPSIATWLAGLNRSEPVTGVPDLGLHVTAARELANTLLESSSEPVLLHGDLHHSNLVRSGGSWVAIDPKGVLGPKEAEPAAFLRNPRSFLLGHSDCVSVLMQRTRIISKSLGFEPTRVAGWGYVLGVLAAAWADEDREGAEEVRKWLVCAAALGEVHRRLSS